MLKKKHILFLTIILLLLSCGGNRLPESQKPIGWADMLNQSSIQANEISFEETEMFLKNQIKQNGNFNLININTNQARLNLSQIDTTLNFEYIMQCGLIEKNNFIRKKTLLPFLLFSPKSGIEIEVEITIYKTKEKKVVLKKIFKEESTKKTGWQIIDFNPNDPDLQINATQIEQYEKNCLKKISQKLIESLSEIALKD